MLNSVRHTKHKYFLRQLFQRFINSAFEYSLKVGGYSYQTGSRILSLLVLFLHYERHKQNDQETFQEKIVK